MVNQHTQTYTQIHGRFDCSGNKLYGHGVEGQLTFTTATGTLQTFDYTMKIMSSSSPTHIVESYVFGIAYVNATTQKGWFFCGQNRFPIHLSTYTNHYEFTRDEDEMDNVAFWFKI